MPAWGRPPRLRWSRGRAFSRTTGTGEVVQGSPAHRRKRKGYEKAGGCDTLNIKLRDDVINAVPTIAYNEVKATVSNLESPAVGIEDCA